MEWFVTLTLNLLVTSLLTEFFHKTIRRIYNIYCTIFCSLHEPFFSPSHFIPYSQQINTFYVPESNFIFLTKVHGILDLPLKYDKICYFCNSGHAAWINYPGWD